MPFGLPLVVGADDNDGGVAFSGERYGSFKFVRVFWCANADAQRTESCPRAHAGDEAHGLTALHWDAVQLLFTSETEILTPARQETLWIIDNNFTLHAQRAHARDYERYVVHAVDLRNKVARHHHREVERVNPRRSRAEIRERGLSCDVGPSRRTTHLVAVVILHSPAHLAVGCAQSVVVDDRRKFVDRHAAAITNRIGSVSLGEPIEQRHRLDGLQARRPTTLRTRDASVGAENGNRLPTADFEWKCRVLITHEHCPGCCGATHQRTLVGVVDRLLD